MNETKEELLQNLGYVKNMLNKISNTLVSRVELEKNYLEKQAKQAHREAIKTEGYQGKINLFVMTICSSMAVFSVLNAIYTKNIFLLLIELFFIRLVYKEWEAKPKLRILILIGLGIDVLDSIGNIIQGFLASLSLFLQPQFLGQTRADNMRNGLKGMLNVALVVVAIVIIAFIVPLVVKAKNKKVAAYNEEVEKTNQEIERINREVEESNRQVAEQQRSLQNQYLQLADELRRNTQAWFPPDYYTHVAVDFFISAIRNHRADTMKEVVNMFDAEQKHREMVQFERQKLSRLNDLVSNTEKMNKQLAFGNMLQMANFFQLSNLNANVSKGFADMNSGFSSVNSNISRNTQAVNDLKKAVYRK